MRIGPQIRSGDGGAPVIIDLIVIVIFFQIRTAFLVRRQPVNLMTQAAFIITLGMAEVMLLSARSTPSTAYRGVRGGHRPVVGHRLAQVVAVIVTLAATAAYGALQGFIITSLRLPSFVVTLAGYLGLSGLLIYLIQATGDIGNGGVIRLNSNVLNDIEGGALSAAGSWIVTIVLVVVFGVILYMRDHRRRANGLVAPPVSINREPCASRSFIAPMRL